MPFEYGSMNWDDLRLFLSVAKAGGLSGAVPECGLSSPSLSRRITEFEQALEVQLFERHAKGYSLTSAGRDLYDQALPMLAQVRAVANWREGLDARPRVRIACGYWTGVFIASNLQQLDAVATGRIRIDILSGPKFLNMSRREADLAIRNVMPSQQGLARKKIGAVDFAIYGAPKYIRNNPDARSKLRYKTCDWLVPSVSGSTGRSALWLSQKLDCSPLLTCDTPQALVQACQAASGLAVLPCITAETDAQLVRCSPTIAALQHTQWLASHDDSRKLSHIKQVSQGLLDLFKCNQTNFTPTIMR